jgi:hypothetical protein
MEPAWVLLLVTRPGTRNPSASAVLRVVIAKPVPVPTFKAKDTGLPEPLGAKPTTVGAPVGRLLRPAPLAVS